MYQNYFSIIWVFKNFY